MDQYSYSHTSNYSSSSSLSASTQFPYNDQYHRHQEITRTTARRPLPFRSALHSVRKNIPSKNLITKKLPIAPLPPTPPRVYKVDPGDFKDVVQKLTGSSSDLQPTRLQEVAPPPLSLSPPHPATFFDNSSEEKPNNRKSFENYCGALSPLGFSLSPASLAWCSSMLMSPGALASFEPNAVLWLGPIILFNFSVIYVCIVMHYIIWSVLNKIIN